jgi:hypothetical protein
MRSFLDLLVKVGIRMAIAVGVLFVSDLVFMVVYTLRKGESDKSEGKTVVINESMTADRRGTLGTNRQILASQYRTKEKVIASRSDFISDDALAAGTATIGQRTMVYAIKLFFLLFGLIFVSLGLIEIKTLGILFILFGNIWFFQIVRTWRRGAKEAKERLAKNYGGVEEGCGALAPAHHPCSPCTDGTEQNV